EADAQKTAQAGFSVDGCYGALVKVETPDWYHQVKEKEKEDYDVEEVIALPQQITMREEPLKAKEFFLVSLLRHVFWCCPSNQKRDDDNTEVLEKKAQL
ncbi:TPA: septation initiation protein, partial [Legionella pneumophila]|nr:septation initiation protein [Legionella pneumophila]HAU2049555.1 septation initiation protein [Legionella pneumophila]HAU2083382.1 septation initiation protein [Legionella pneumophila]HAU2104001.1 septation initiation protein [Legionella pneumophila]